MINPFLGNYDFVIYKIHKSAMQSGKILTHYWKVKYNKFVKSDESDIMNWNSGTEADLKIQFSTLEDAKRYLENKKKSYIVDC